MDKRYFLKRVLTGIFLTLCITVFAQKTAVYTRPDADFSSALELFQKQKYGSAQKIFRKVMNRHAHEPHSLIHIDAEYYAALCALELFHKDAELLLKNFITSHGESPRVQTACFYLGKYNYRKKQYLRTLEWFAKVDLYELNNEDLSEFYFKRGYSYLELDSTEKARKDFFEIKDIDNKYAAPATYYFGHIAYREKNYQTALQHFLRLKNHASFGSVVPYYIAQIYYLQGKYDSVITFATPLLDSTSRRVMELTKIVGESYFRTGRYKECLPYLEKYKGYSPYLKYPEWYQLGFAYYKNQDFNQAVYCFQKATAGNDSIAQNAYYHLGDCFLRPSPFSGGNNSRMMAKNAFESAWKLNLDKQITEDALFNYAKLCYELSYSPFNEAITGLNEYITRYPASPRIDECYRYLVNVYLTTKNYKAAMQSIESIRQMNEEMRTAYQKISFLYGLQEFSNGRWNECISLLDKSFRYPVNPVYTSLAQFWKGESYYRLSETDKLSDGLDSAILGYRNFLGAQGAINHPEYYSAHYNLGYGYFKKGNFKDANLWFRKYTGLRSDLPKEKLNDAFLRIGDGFFMMKDYVNAVDYYTEALKTGTRDADYALYQKALAEGVTGKREAKSKTLTELLTRYAAKTKYEAAAKYEMALNALQLGNDETALNYYQKVVSEHPECSYTGRSMLQIGLIRSRKKDYDGAIATLDKVLASWPKSTEAFEAISAMKDIYRAKGDMDSFENKLRTIPYAGISVASLDSSNYDVAFDYYDKGDCENAMKNFQKYLTKYPDGIFVIPATFYKSECEYLGKKYDLALGGYQYVIDKPYGPYTESSLLKASFINYRNKNYQNALNQYIRLAQVAEYPANASEGKIGTMRCQMLLGQYDLASEAAKQVLALDKLTPELQAEARLVIGKAAAEKQNFQEANSEFNQVVSLTRSEKSAEAKYHLAYIQFQQGQFKESQKSVFELINQDPGYDYWIGKGFILLSDNYVGLNDLFNARFALEKLIEKSPNAELTAVAREKLARIKELEDKQKAEEEKKKVKAQEPSLIVTPDNPKDSVLYKEEGKQ